MTETRIAGGPIGKLLAVLIALAMLAVWWLWPSASNLSCDTPRDEARVLLRDPGEMRDWLDRCPPSGRPATLPCDTHPAQALRLLDDTTDWFDWLDRCHLEAP